MGFSACGLRLQVRDRIFGRLTGNPRDPDAMVETLDDMLRTPMQRELHGGKAQRQRNERAPQSGSLKADTIPSKKRRALTPSVRLR